MKNKSIEFNNNNNKYELIKDDDKCFDQEIVAEKVTDYFDDYDYIFGDFAYGKVRLKGFYDSKNKKAKKINDIKYLEDYIKNYCCYGAKTFLLKKIK